MTGNAREARTGDSYVWRMPRLSRASYAIITILASLITVIGGDEGFGWPFILGHFVVAWVLIVAFAWMGKVLFRRHQ